MSSLSPAPTAEKTGTEPQYVETPLSVAATFLVLTINDGDAALATARSVVASTGDLIKDIRSRSLRGNFTCNVGLSRRVWDGLTGGAPLPAELTEFREIKGAKHTAVSTPGGLLYHIRSESTDLNVEFEKLLLEFIDGTANPEGADLAISTLIGDEDPAYAGGSYVVIQKYLHNLGDWRRESAETQEQIIGRTKFDNVELPDATEGQKSHKTLCTITDAAGEHDILRDNMPFASPGRGEYGTYFIGYSRHVWVIEKMLERMFIGDPPPPHDRILDFSTAVTGASFFVPPRAFLAGLGG